MLGNKRRTTVVALSGVAAIIASTGTALAISGGGYHPHKQGCAIKADSTDRAHRKQAKGCHDATLMVGDGKGHSYFEAGTRTTKQGQNVHSGNVSVSPDGSGNPKGGVSGTGTTINFDTNWQPIPNGQCGVFDLLTYAIAVATGGACKFDPSQWNMPAQPPTVTPKVSTKKSKHGSSPSLTNLDVYFGADDGLDTGEHDEPNGKHGTKKEQNGPSDGGSIDVNWHPLATTAWFSMLVAGVQKANLSGAAHNPLPLLSAGAGYCADGICTSVQTKRTAVFHGGGKGGKNRNVYDYSGKTWDPYNCSGQSPQSQKACKDKSHKNEDSYWKQDAKNVNAEPGIQFYEDPDPNGSPALPVYPLPGLYAGTCGVTAGGGAMPAPSSPVTNKAGQVSVSPTGC